MEGIEIQVKFRERQLFACCKIKGMLWFRIFGRGLHFKNTKHHWILFSERYGYTKFLKVGNWHIKILGNIYENPELMED